MCAGGGVIFINKYKERGVGDTASKKKEKKRRTKSKGLVSLFNGISTLFRLFNAKSILLQEQ